MARQRTPTALKLVKGTAQPCRTNKKEPKPQRQIPSPPEHMSDRAKVAYGRVSVILDRMGVLTEADGLALEAMCEAYADLIEARQALRKPIAIEIKSEDGVGKYPYEVAKPGEVTYVTVGKSGPMARSRPEMALIADADNRLRSWMARFGMTPADRSRVSSVGEDGSEKDPWSQL